MPFGFIVDIIISSFIKIVNTSSDFPAFLMNFNKSQTTFLVSITPFVGKKERHRRLPFIKYIYAHSASIVEITAKRVSAVSRSSFSSGE